MAREAILREDRQNVFFKSQWALRQNRKRQNENGSACAYRTLRALRRILYESTDDFSAGDSHIRRCF